MALFSLRQQRLAPGSRACYSCHAEQANQLRHPTLPAKSTRCSMVGGCWPEASASRIDSSACDLLAARSNLVFKRSSLWLWPAAGTPEACCSCLHSAASGGVAASKHAPPLLTGWSARSWLWRRWRAPWTPPPAPPARPAPQAISHSCHDSLVLLSRQGQLLHPALKSDYKTTGKQQQCQTKREAASSPGRCPQRAR